MKLAWIKRLTLVGVAASLTTSCIMYRLEELRHTTPSGSPFQNELSKLYMDFAAQEEKDYDWFSSWHFADKGLMLAYGKDVPPEELKDWSLPAEMLPEMEKMRTRLMELLTPDLMAASPSRAADLQFYFDCWVEQQTENWQEDDIAYCRDNLIRAMGEVNALPMPVEKAQKPRKVKKASAVVVPDESKATSPVIENTKEAKAIIPESTSYAVFFEPGRGEVTDQGRNVITEVVKSLQGVSDYEVVLHANKDYPGKAAERIAVTKTLLEAGGVKDGAIRAGSVKANDGAGKPGQRRVEIFLNE